MKRIGTMQVASKVQWVKDERDGDLAMLGEWRVGNVIWDRMARDDAPYGVYCRLPGLKVQQGRVNTLEEGKAKLEAAVARWLRGIGVKAEGR